MMVADAERRIAEAVVMSEGESLIMPCGGCRQHLREFADDATPIHLCGPPGVQRTVTLGELLPFPFSLGSPAAS
jgi:cytidine deaminase